MMLPRAGPAVAGGVALSPPRATGRAPDGGLGPGMTPFVDLKHDGMGRPIMP